MKQIKVSDEIYKKLNTISNDKGCSFGESIAFLEKVVMKNFPHSTATELIKCDACRKNVIKAIQDQGYWPKPEIKEIVKVVEIPAKGPIKHLTVETIPLKHLFHTDQIRKHLI